MKILECLHSRALILGVPVIRQYVFARGRIVQLLSMALATAGLLLTNPAFAGPNNPSCQNLAPLLDGARQNFGDISDQTLIANSLDSLAADECGVASGLEGRRLLYCFWRFPYRSPDAGNWFRQLDATIKKCGNETSKMDEDVPVNHPDTFLLKSFQLQGAEISISVKDKGAIQSTLVFVRFQNQVD